MSVQSADAQEQVEGLLAENNALRTSLAALEQVQDIWDPLLTLPIPLSPSFFWSTPGQGDPEPHAVVWPLFCFSFLASISIVFGIYPCFPSILVSLQ